MEDLRRWTEDLIRRLSGVSADMDPEELKQLREVCVLVSRGAQAQWRWAHGAWRYPRDGEVF